jgi:hypothetical protein
MKVFDALWHMDTRSVHGVNQALLILLPKSPDAASMKDNRPISLIHIMGKLLSKVLINRLAPRLADLVHISQSAFLKGRLIHDNFCFVQSAARLLHVRRQACLLFKVDIVRAFNSVSWPFLIEILEFMGFPAVWWNWVTTLLSSATTRVSMNNNPGATIYHAHGLWQGNLLSPMLFLILMEVLSALVRKAGH